MSKTEEKEKGQRFFWETVPGIIASLIALLTAIIGCIAAIIGSPQILGFFMPASPTPIIVTSTPPAPDAVTSSPIPPENTPLPSLEPTVLVVVVTEIATQPPAPTRKMYGFTLCSNACNGSNAITSRLLPERTKKVHAQWQYENIPPGSDYTRTWSMEGAEWVRYHCTWPGPESGTFTVTLSEPAGLKSGVWQMTITVNGQVLLVEKIEVLGNWDHWDPAGSFEKCR